MQGSPTLQRGEEIGAGALASVMRVRDPGTGATYAGKVLHPRHRRDPMSVQRFAREAELAHGLAHPNLVRVFGVLPVEGEDTLLMELVEGPTLSDVVARDAPLDEGRVVAVVRGVASGLWHAHAAGVIHRDLKPANVLMAPPPSPAAYPVPKIADFGMARAASFAAIDQGSMTVLGTPEYMAPECLDPLAVDARTDLYALGCMIFEMATGAPPFSGATPFAILEAHRKAPIPDLPAGYSEGLRDLTRRLLAKSPGDRPQSAAAVLAELDSLTGTALARPTDVAMAAVSGRCVACEAELVPGMDVCFECGAPQIVLEPGNVQVFVVGPGNVGNRLDASLRSTLLRWIDGNPEIGLDASRLREASPRLPFVLVLGVSESSGNALRHVLGHLGLQVDLRRGSRLGHEKMVRKAGTMGLRTTTPVFALAGGLLFMPLGALIAFATIPFMALAFVVGALRSARPVMTKVKRTRPELPGKVRDRLVQVRETVPRIEQRRHRQALRAVVSRIMSLVRSIPSAELAPLEAEMDHALNVALVSATRLDELDRRVASPGFDPTQTHERSELQERDRWAARLLDLTAAVLRVQRAGLSAKRIPEGVR